eukprot:TRINITY_DN5101_c0_g1_i1.p1 TRINITY_DN5101_c0_g1~~TRINITY_DN5101_c0_g1_i1.p1  ORF type:complete len:216 (-),score=58.42 TRINITY_DN5101_c0_g1_i1:100-747(-)
MGVYYIFIVSKSGGLIFNYDHSVPATEHEKTYSYPLEIQLKFENKRVIVSFGERDGVCIGHALLAVNGQPLSYKELPDGRDVFDVLADKTNFPLNLKFGRPKITTNEKIVLASMFYPLYALAVQLSPDQGSSGIQELETDTFKLHCNQTLTGVKFIVIADRNQQGIDQLLDKVYELYADYALKNPFYSLEMPIRADLFEEHLQVAIDQIEKTGFI